MRAPTGVPRAIPGRINADVLKVVAMPEIAQDYALAPGAPEAMNRLIASDITKYSKVIREANIRIN